MLKKRLIFTLLYADGHFMQSRNFNIQKVGDINWLRKNYNLNSISNYIDELIILDISRTKRSLDEFIMNLKKISKEFFIPITAGGGIRTFKHASRLLRNGADKILINSILNTNENLINQIATTYGSQSIIAGIDYIYSESKKIDCLINNGETLVKKDFLKYLKEINTFQVGEVYINSIDKDGTGMGLDLNILKKIPKNFIKPIILSGGCGNYHHIKDGLLRKEVDAVSTANLFNFINNGFKLVRNELFKNNFKLTHWDPSTIEKLKDVFK